MSASEGMSFVDAFPWGQIRPSADKHAPLRTFAAFRLDGGGEHGLGCERGLLGEFV